MIKTITQIGDAQGITLDAALLQLAGLKEGDAVNVEVHSGGMITVTPMAPRAKITTVIQDTMNQYAQTMQRLA